MSKAIKQEEYEQRLKDKHIQVELVGEFVNMSTKALHRCLKHNIVWEALPHNILKGKGCKQCKLEKIHEKRTKTHEQYVEELSRINPNIEVIEEYKGVHVKILHRCKIDGCEWKAKPGNILQGNGCPKCAEYVNYSSKAKTHKEYIQEVKKVNPNIEVIGTYINAKTKIMHHCLVHDIYWETIPDMILKGHGCKECRADKLRAKMNKTHDQYVEELSLINPNIIVVGTYVDAKTKILHYCKRHDVYWDATPNQLLGGHGCPKCRDQATKERSTKSNEEYVEQLKKYNSDIIALDEYIDSKTKIKHKCLICGYEWSTSPTTILNGGGCPRCQETSGERKARQWFERESINYVYQMRYDDCRDINTLSFDFYLPDFNTLVEIQGLQHYKPIPYFGGEEKYLKQQKHDNIKRDYCKKNGINLIEIPDSANIEETLNNFLFT